MNCAEATGHLSDYSSPVTQSQTQWPYAPPSEGKGLSRYIKVEQEKPLIDNVQYYRNTRGAINYSDCVLTESPGVLSLPVILLKTFDHSSEGVAPSETSYVSGPYGQSSFHLHICFCPTKLSSPPLCDPFFALALLFFELHKYSTLGRQI